MTVPTLTQTEFIDHLKSNGFEVVSDKFWNEYDRIIIKKDGFPAVPFQMKKLYFFPMVCKVCEQLEIPAPSDHQKCYDQIKVLKKKK